MQFRKLQTDIERYRKEFEDFLRYWEEIQKEFLSTREISELLNVHRNTVLLWIRTKKLKAIRVGKIYMVKRDWLREFFYDYLLPYEYHENLDEEKEEEIKAVK
jgi:excisionase family DNA binding protein